MGRIGYGLIAVLVLALPIVLFAIQNSTRTTGLELDLYVAAWRLKEPVSITALMGICIGLGFLLGFLPMWVRSWRLSGKITALERDMALSGLAKPQEDAGKRGAGSW